MAHETKLVVRFNELDPYNHVNNATWATYLEVGREDALRANDMPIDRLVGEGIQLVIARLDIRYRGAAGYGDQLTVHTALGKMRRASGIWRQWVTRGEDVLVSADVTIGVTDRSGRPIRPPEWVMAGLARLAVEEPGDAGDAAGGAAQ